MNTSKAANLNAFLLFKKTKKQITKKKPPPKKTQKPSTEINLLDLILN